MQEKIKKEKGIMKTKGKALLNRLLAAILAVNMIFTMVCPMPARADAITAQNDRIVLTLGADLTKDQKAYVLKYFGISEDDVITVTITNDDEREQLGGLIPEEQIGTHTYSCALIRPTSGGGVQVKTANMSYVTSNMIASTLSTSGVYNCEVLTVAPFMVSGTGALTGIMMAYAEAMGIEIDPELQELANEEIVLTGEVAEDVGQDQATLIVNDIKIHIIRDQVEDEEEIEEIVDEVIETTEKAAEEAGVGTGKKLGEVEHKKLYDYGNKVASMDYNYKDVQRTLERVTYNVAKKAGIKDPITDTFSTITDDEGLLADSILLGTDDDVLGDDANINATSNVALGEHPAEIIDVFEGDVKIKSAGSVKADGFINGTDLVSYRDLNGSYALMDLNGNMLTEAVFEDRFKSAYGVITGEINDGSNMKGALATDGTLLIPFDYEKVEILGSLWGVGYNLKPTKSNDDYDFYSGDDHFVVDEYDLYYFGDEDAEPIAILDREEFKNARTLGDYINIEDRDGYITTYDSEFDEIGESEYVSDFGDLNTDEKLSKDLGKATGLSFFGFKGNYSMVADYKRDKYGVGDKYGNIIIPVELDKVVGYGDSLMVGGYCAGVLDDEYVYVIQDGDITGEFDYNKEISYYGMSSLLKSGSGDFTIYSGDGEETKLSKKYDYVNSIDSSKGMLYKGTKDNKYDLIDWHGNVLIEGSSGISVSANGKYVISQDGYTSSTLYMLNDASMVRLASSDGGAKEVAATKMEKLSMDTYTGEPKLKAMGTIDADDFLGYSDTLVYRNNKKYGLMSIDGKKLTSAEYDDIEYKKGYLRVTKETAKGYKVGILTVDGIEVVPCEYGYAEIKNEHWIFASTLAPATEKDYDFVSYWADNEKDKYKMIDEAFIIHTPGYDIDEDSEILQVSLTRDDYADCDVDGDYINIKDRSTGNVTTYDGEFNMVASVDYVSDFKEFSSDYVLRKTLKDKIGKDYYLDQVNIKGYATVNNKGKGDNYLYGIVDADGKEILPAEYEYIGYYSDKDGIQNLLDGYFCVVKDGKYQYVTEGGKVTCDTGYSYSKGDKYLNNLGLAGSYKASNGKYTIVTADGNILSGFDIATGFANGLLWKVYDGKKNSLIDWHGNVLFKDIDNVKAAENGNYILVIEEYGSTPKLYAIEK